MNRKTFLATIISGIAIWLVMPKHKVRSIFKRLKKRPAPDRHVLKTTAAIAEYIYPEDEEAGAISLGIRNFFTLQLTTSYYRKRIPGVVRLVDYLDRECGKMCGRDFVYAETEIKKKLLDSIASGEKDRVSIKIRKDLFALIDLTLEGCFSDPMHGANKNRQAWQLMGGTIREEWFYA